MKDLDMQRGSPLISVGITTYNRPEDLRRTLECITEQTYKNLDIIVSDNASTIEGVDKIVADFAQDDKRIRYYRQPENRGPGFNFQFVLDQARGKHFMWVADDDRRSLDYIASLWEALNKDSSSIAAFSNFDEVDQNGNVVPGRPDPIVAMRLMAADSAISRQLRFFLMNEGSAVPHVIYGLIPLRILRGFSWDSFFKNYGIYGADVLFIFWLLGQGRLALVDRKLFGCTVNNQKHYGSLQRRSLVKKLQTVLQRVGYLFSFVKLSKGWVRGALLCVFPLKLSEMLYSMAVREPFQKVMRALKKR